MIINNITEIIGNTPLLRIPASFHGIENLELYAKLEMCNPFGSVKDRTAYALLRDDLTQIAKDHKTIYENSSGNTAKSLQAIAGQQGIKVKIVSGLSKVQEQKDAISFLGAELEEFAAANDCFDPNDPNDPQYLIEKAVKESPDKVFFTSQFTNQKNVQIHEETTGQEIINDLGKVDYYFGGLGTTGSSLGIIKKLREANKDFKGIGVTSKKQQFIPGIRSLDQMWESGLFKKEEYNKIIDISDKEAVQYTIRLNRELGVLCGPSSGCNYAAVIKYFKEINEIGKKTVAVFMVCDRVESYFSYLKERVPELFQAEPKPNSLANFEFDPESESFSLDVNQIEEWKQKNANTLIIDVRSKISYEMNSIPGSINISHDYFEKIIDQNKPFPQNINLLLVCAVGEKTIRYSAYLRSKGYSCFSVKNGMRAFQFNKINIWN